MQNIWWVNDFKNMDISDKKIPWQNNIKWHLPNKELWKKYEVTISKLWDDITSTSEWRKAITKARWLEKNGIHTDPVYFNNPNYAFWIIKNLPKKLLENNNITNELIENLNWFFKTKEEQYNFTKYLDWMVNFMIEELKLIDDLSVEDSTELESDLYDISIYGKPQYKYLALKKIKKKYLMMAWLEDIIIEIDRAIIDKIWSDISLIKNSINNVLDFPIHTSQLHKSKEKKIKSVRVASVW